LVNTVSQRDPESARKGEVRRDDRATISTLGGELAETQPADVEDTVSLSTRGFADPESASRAADALSSLIAANSQVAAAAQANCQSGIVLELL
jgi:hypothetical protein